jgi:hypothetical protein
VVTGEYHRYRGRRLGGLARRGDDVLLFPIIVLHHNLFGSAP